MVSFRLATDATFEDVARTLDELPSQRYGHPVAIDITLSPELPDPGPSTFKAYAEAPHRRTFRCHSRSPPRPSHFLNSPFCGKHGNFTNPGTQRENHMSLMNLLITLIVVGVLLWAINTYLPMDRKIKSILNIVVVLVVVVWLLRAFGVLQSIGGIHMGG